MLSPEDLDAIRSRSEAVTPSFFTDEYVEFSKHARTDVPRLLDEVERLNMAGECLFGASLDWKVRMEKAEATIAEVRAELNEAFDDIDRDCEGKPNELDCMVRLAAGELKNARSHCDRETERADNAEHRIAQLRSRVNLEMAKTATPDSSPDVRIPSMGHTVYYIDSEEEDPTPEEPTRVAELESLACWLRGRLESELTEYEGCERFEGLMNDVSEKCDTLLHTPKATP